MQPDKVIGIEALRSRRTPLYVKPEPPPEPPKDYSTDIAKVRDDAERVLLESIESLRSMVSTMVADVEANGVRRCEDLASRLSQAQSACDELNAKIKSIREIFTGNAQTIEMRVKALDDAHGVLARRIEEVRALTLQQAQPEVEDVEVRKVELGQQNTLVISYSDGHKETIQLPHAGKRQTSLNGGPGVVYTSAVFKIRTVTANVTLLNVDNMILCDCTAGDITVTLPKAKLARDAQNLIKKIDASSNKVIITGDQIEGTDSVTITRQNTGLHIFSTNSDYGWVIS